MRPDRHSIEFTIIREFEGGLTEIRDSRGVRRRCRIYSCVQCEARVPDFIFGAMALLNTETSKMCPSCAEEFNHQKVDQNRIRHHRKRYENGDLPYQRRMAALALASPRWRDRAAIKAIYEEARAKTIETGIQHHVDHYYPLQGDYCCGLHVHQNLRIITATENCSKHKRHPMDQSPALAL